jgi:hypothetical protein
MKRLWVILFVIHFGCGEEEGSSSQNVNSVPDVGADITVSLPENTIAGPLNLTPPTDSDGDILTLVVTAVPTSGKLLKGGEKNGHSVSVSYNIGINNNIFGPTGLNFTPDPDAHDGNANFGNFSYSVSDGQATVTRTITISIYEVSSAAHSN